MSNGKKPISEILSPDESILNNPSTDPTDSKKKSIGDILSNSTIGDKPKDEDSFIQNFGEGFEIGGKGLVAGVAYAAADIGSLFTDDDWWTKETKSWAQEYRASAPEADNSVGQFLGGLVPSTLPTAALIAAAPFTGGATAPAAWITAGGLGLASAGQGMMDYDAYKASTGKISNPAERAAVGIAYGSAEMLMERLALSKFLPNPGSFMLRGNVDDALKVGKQLISKYTKGNKKNIELLKKIGSGAPIEGSQEAMTELAQNITDNLYRDVQDRYDTGEILNNMKHAAIGGALMGAGLGGLSFKAQDITNNKRRKKQGFVRLGQLNNEAVEVLGMTKDEKMQIMYPDGVTKEVDPTLVENPVNVSVNQFENILKGKTDESTAVEQSRIEFQQQERKDVLDTFDQIYGQHTTEQEGQKYLTLANMGEARLIVTAESRQDPEIVYVVDEMAQGTPRPVASKDLENVVTLPVEQWQERFLGPKLSNIADPMTPPPVIGEEINHPQGKGRVIAYDPQTGDATIEIERRTGKGDEVELINESPVDRSELDLYRSFDMKTAEQVVIEADDQAVQFNEEGTPVQSDQTTNKSITLEVEGQDPVIANQIDEETFESSGYKFKAAESIRESLAEEYPNLSVETVDRTDLTNPYAKANFSVQIKTKKDATQDTTKQEQVGQDQQQNKGNTGAQEVSGQAEGRSEDIPSPDIQEQAGSQDVAKPSVPRNQEGSATKVQAGTKADEKGSKKPTQGRSKQNISIRPEEKVIVKKKVTQKKKKAKKKVTFRKKLTEEQEKQATNLANQYIDTRRAKTHLSTVERVIQEHGAKTNRQSFIRFNDKNNITQGVGKSYFRNDALSLDQIAQEINEDNFGGQERVSPEDVAEFMLKYPNGYQTAEIGPESRELESQYQELTGKKINIHTAKQRAEKADISELGERAPFQKVLNDTPKMVRRLRKADETNMATNYVNPFIKQNKPLIEKEAAKFKKKYPGSPDIVVMESHLDLQNMFLETPFEDLYNRNAFYHPADGKVYLIASAQGGQRFSNPAMIEQTLLHEIVGHFGVRKALDYAGKDGVKKFNDFMDKVAEEYNTDATFQMISETYVPGKEFKDLSSEEKRLVSEEYIAHVAETNTNKPLIQRIIDWFKDLLGIQTDMSDDMVRDIIANGRAVVQVGDGMVTRPLSPLFQMTAYHGSPKLFNEFRSDFIDGRPSANQFGWGLYFTNKEEIAKSYSVNLQRPGIPEPPEGVTKRQLLRAFRKAANRQDMINSLGPQSQEVINYIDQYMNPQHFMYKVDIHGGKTPDQYDYLDWDEVITDTQAKKVADIMNTSPYRFQGKSGREVYQTATSYFGDQEQASKNLLSAGIDGITFQTFKGGVGTNYVVFDDSQVSIAETLRFQKIDNGEKITNFVTNEDNKKQVSAGEYQESIRQTFEAVHNAIRPSVEAASPEQRQEVEQRAAREYAEQNNLIHKSLYDLGTKFPGGGIENTLAYSEKDGYIYKSNNLFPHKGSILNYINSIQRHNALFPETHYEFMGFEEVMKNKKPFLKPVVRQKFVIGKPATQEQIYEYMSNSGFSPIYNTIFQKDNLIVSDIRPNNVLVDEDGTIYIIDDIVKEEKPQQVRFQVSPPTNSKAFKNWFSKSKVIDEKGQPLIVFHGSPFKFDAFDPHKTGDGHDVEGPGFYFTNNKEEASGYTRSQEGQVIDACLKIENPVPLTGNVKKEDIEKLVLMSTGFNSIKDIENWMDTDEDSFWESPLSNYDEFPIGAFHEAVKSIMEYNTTPHEAFQTIWYDIYGADNVKYMQAMVELGYDGVIIKGESHHAGNDHYIVFNPSNIKSASKNVGTYDPNKTNIRFQISSDAKSQVDEYDLLKKLESDPIKIGEFYYEPTYSITWYNQDEDIQEYSEDSIDDAYFESQSPDEYSGAYTDHSKRIEVFFKKLTLDEYGDFIEEEQISAEELFYNTKNSQIEAFKDTGIVYVKDYGSREGNARELENEVYWNLGKDIISDHNGLKIRGVSGRKYSNISIENSEGDEIGVINLRIANHAYNPRNNLLDENTDFISVEIANVNETEGKFVGEKSLQYDDEASYDQILKDVNERITEIIDDKGWGDDPSPRFQMGHYNTDDQLRFQRQTPSKDNFYSNSLQAIRNVNQGKATGDQWKSMLLKNGASQVELDWIEFDDWLKSNPKPSKEQVYDFIKSNKIEIQEVMKGEAESVTRDDVESVRFKDFGQGSWEVTFKDSDLGSIEVPADEADSESMAILGALERANYDDSGKVKNKPKYSDYQLPGGENYKELLLTMPSVKPKIEKLTELPEGYSLTRDSLNNTWGVTPDDQGHARSITGIYHPTKEEAISKALDEINSNIKLREEAKMREGQYRSSHWDEPNILSHIRFNEREAGGEKVLFIEELQSDWQSEGRKKGFKPNQSEINKVKSERDKIQDQILKNKERINEDTSDDLYKAIREENKELKEKWTDLDDRYMVMENFTVPQMPFKQTNQWLNLSMRRMIKYAAENGFDRVAWINGEQSADRYDLSHQVKKISVLKGRRDDEYQLVIEDNSGQEIPEYSRSGKSVTSKELEDTIGKEMAKRAIEGAEAKAGKTYNENEWADFSGLDLKVGGEGMKSFYNKIIPSTTKKLLKKLDKTASVENIEIRLSSGIPTNEFTEIAVVDELDSNRSIQQSFPITPLIRQTALKQGMPMFQKEVPVEYTEDQYFKKLDRHIQTWQDRYIYLKRLQDFKRERGRTITDDMNAYDKENLSWGKMREQDRQFKRDYVDPLDKTLKTLKSEGLDYETTSRYLKAKHIFTDKVEAGGIPIEEAELIVKEFESQAKKESVNELSNNIRKINNFVLEKQLEYGLLSKQRYDMYQKQFKFYVPLRGFADLDDSDKTIFTKDYKRKGRTSESGDPIPYLMLSAQTAIYRGEQNRIKQALLEFVKHNPDSKLYKIRNAWYLTDPETGNVTAKYTNPTPEEHEKFDVSRQEPLPENMTMQQYNDFKTSTKFEEDALSVMVDGRKIMIDFTDGNITRTFKKQNIDRVPSYLQWGNRVIAYLRSAYTQYSPEFGPRNFIRDASTGLINVRNDFGGNTSATVAKNIASAAKAVKRGLLNDNFEGRDGKLMQEFVEGGGLTGYSDLKDISTLRAEMKAQVEGMKKATLNLATVQNTAAFKYTLGALDNINRVLENTMRFATYKTLRNKGVSPQEAAIYAKDVTVNFNRKGTAANFMGSLYLFWNASIQGIERLARPFVGSDKKARSRAIQTALTLPAFHIALSILNRVVGGEDDDEQYYYDKLSDYDRTHNLIIANPFDEGKFFRIPLPYGFNVFFAWPDNLVNAIMGKENPVDAVVKTIALGMESFSPLGAPQFDSDVTTEGKILMYSAPTMLKAPMEVAFNTNFMGTPIFKEQLPFGTPRPDSEMHFSSVDPIFKGIASGLNEFTGGDSETAGWVDINPEVMEHYWGSYTGGLGKFANNALATMINLSQHGAETFTTDKVKDVPFVRNYVTSPSPGAERAVFFSKIKEVQAKEDIFNRYRKANNVERAREYREENKDMLRLAGLADTYQKQIKNITELERSFRAMGMDSEADKQAEKAQKIYKDFNKEYNRAIKGERTQIADILGL